MNRDESLSVRAIAVSAIAVTLSCNGYGVPSSSPAGTPLPDGVAEIALSARIRDVRMVFSRTLTDELMVFGYSTPLSETLFSVSPSGLVKEIASFPPTSSHSFALELPSGTVVVGELTWPDDQGGTLVPQLVYISPDGQKRDVAMWDSDDLPLLPIGAAATSAGDEIILLASKPAQQDIRLYRISAEGELTLIRSGLPLNNPSVALKDALTESLIVNDIDASATKPVIARVSFEGEVREVAGVEQLESFSGSTQDPQTGDLILNEFDYSRSVGALWRLTEAGELLELFSGEPGGPFQPMLVAYQSVSGDLFATGTRLDGTMRLFRVDLDSLASPMERD